MSNALAIASVTAVLKDLLINGIIDHELPPAVGAVIVTALPPDAIEITGSNKRSQLNLFLYQVTPNQGWRNVGLPSHDDRGERLNNPPLALDLHYLLTAYGAEELHGEVLLGYGMQLFHETPVLARPAIHKALDPPSPVTGGGGLPQDLQNLVTSELAEQVEQIKITPQSLSTEEVSKLWAAFGAKYRPTAAYQASVVLIEGRRSTRTPLPVRARKIYVIPFKQPVIDQISSQANANAPIKTGQPILTGYNLVIIGRQLLADDTRVKIGGTETTPGSDATNTRIVLPIPTNLPAGVQGLQIIHYQLMGSPETPHRGVESNLAAFVLAPRIDAVNIFNVQGAGNAPRSADIVVNVKPALGEKQRVVLLLNEFVPALVSPPEPNETPARAYSFNAPAGSQASPPGSTETISIPISDVQAGIYLVRLQVDGAQSPLETDVSGQFASPRVTIP